MARESLAQLVAKRNEADGQADHYCDRDDWQTSQLFDVERIKYEDMIDRRVNGPFGLKRAWRRLRGIPQPKLY